MLNRRGFLKAAGMASLVPAGLLSVASPPPPSGVSLADIERARKALRGKPQTADHDGPSKDSVTLTRSGIHGTIGFPERILRITNDDARLIVLCEHSVWEVSEDWGGCLVKELIGRL